MELFTNELELSLRTDPHNSVRSFPPLCRRGWSSSIAIGADFAQGGKAVLSYPGDPTEPINN
jgi:thiamine pyrophosphate-dependent acetolactate synthase large subunit-like protein